MLTADLCFCFQGTKCFYFEMKHRHLWPFTRCCFTAPWVSCSYHLLSSKLSAHTAHPAVSSCPLHFLTPLHHHRGFRRNARRERSAMTRVVVEGMPETAAGGRGVMLNRRRSKARRKKRKELFAFQMCFLGGLLGLVAGLQTVAQRAGEGHVSHFTVLNTCLCHVYDVYDVYDVHDVHEERRAAARSLREEGPTGSLDGERCSAYSFLYWSFLKCTCCVFIS